MGIYHLMNEEEREVNNKKKEDSEKLYNSIVRIIIALNNEKQIVGTGFFIKVNIKNKNRYFLMTCQHIIHEEYIDEKKAINLYYGKYNKEKNLDIILDRKKRFIKYFHYPFDSDIIEILDEDNIKEDNFLIPILKYKNNYNSYLNNYIYLASYSQNNEIIMSSGKINKILSVSEFEYSIDTDLGNSGSSICLSNNLSIIGMNKEGKNNENYGIFLGHILDNIENEIEGKKSNKIDLNNVKSIFMIK